MMFAKNSARLELLPSFLVNVSAGYFLLAASIPGFSKFKSIDDTILFLFNSTLAIIYYELAVKVEEIKTHG